MRKLLLSLVLVLGLAVPAQAQFTMPYVFESGTTILASEVNANFALLAQNALNRTGGTITGNIDVDADITIDGVDISDFLLATGQVRAATSGTTGAPSFAPASDTDTGLYFPAAGSVGFSLNGTERLRLDSNGLTVFGTNIVNSSGKIPALSSTYFASLDASNLTGIPESSITDGTILARLASNETVTGAWSFSSGLTIAPTWNSGATVFTALDFDITDTASASGSKILDAKVGGTSKFSVDKNGKATMTAFQLTTGASNGSVLTSDASGNASWQALPAGATGVPSGMVAMFEEACPAGWTSRSGAGEPYQNKFVRGGATYSEAGGGSDTHTHTIDPPSTATTTDGAHQHSVDPVSTATSTDGAHIHGITGSGTTSSAGSHTHTINFGTVATSGPNNTVSFSTGGGVQVASGGHTHNVTIGTETTSSNGSHTHSITWPDTDSAGSHSHTVDIASTLTTSAGSHSHTVNITSFSSSSASNVPAYIQVVFCRKD